MDQGEFLARLGSCAEIESAGINRGILTTGKGPGDCGHEFAAASQVVPCAPLAVSDNRGGALTNSVNNQDCRGPNGRRRTKLFNLPAIKTSAICVAVRFGFFAFKRRRQINH